ncbi:hypothetical protein U7230_15245 [Carboxydochorda subterranea]|uniref:Uncharacterized protein n=1 Tax=Carboxydichorda subterranea TaxID=3109565 RepID=A0ABZ1BXJ1_9FIRM|nr:hypothetical protein [Limnochorda sp. L945t]WRP17414.1 hypothetical protein U7230_15245 [Limnochorda sp. L945t]
MAFRETIVRLGTTCAALVAFILTFGSLTAAAQDGMTIAAEPLYVSFTGADIHILDEVLDWQKPTPEGVAYSREVTPRWFQPGPSLVPRLTASVGLTPDFTLAAEGLFVDWGDSESRHFEAPPSVSGDVSYRNAVFLWDGNFRLPDESQFAMPNDQHPSGWSPIDWSADAGIRLASGSVGARIRLFSGGGFEVAAEGGLSIFHLDHHFNRRVAMTFQGATDWYTESEGTQTVLEYVRNRITLDEKASSTGTVFGPNVGLRLSAYLGDAFIEASASQGILMGILQTSSRFVDVDDALVDTANPPDGIWDYHDVLRGDIPFEEDVRTTIPATRIALSVSYPVGPAQIGVGAFYSLYRNVPVSPGLSYRDMTFKRRTQDMGLSGIGAFARLSF